MSERLEDLLMAAKASVMDLATDDSNVQTAERLFALSADETVALLVTIANDVRGIARMSEPGETPARLCSIAFVLGVNLGRKLQSSESLNDLLGEP